MYRRPRVLFIAVLVAVSGLLTACGTKGTPTAAEPDVRSLDVGDYPVDRHSYDQDSHGAGALLEGMRMSQAVVPSARIDPSLSVGQGGRVIPGTAAAVDHLLAVASRPVLDNRKMVVGYVSGGSDVPDAPSPTATAVTDLVMRFPDATAAAQAARELEDVDYAVAPDLNRKLALPQYPDAFVHYRPGVPTIGAFLAHREYVISLYIERPQAVEADLLSWVRKTFDAQVPALDGFRPTPQNQLNTLRVDPDGLLARAVVRNRSGRTPDPDRFAVYAAPYLVADARDEAIGQRQVDDTGTDAVAVADTSSVLRVRDENAGRRLIDGLIVSNGSDYRAADAPKTVPGARCVQRTASADSGSNPRFRCYVHYRRYVEIVWSNEQADIQQKTAAAYALLANSW